MVEKLRFILLSIIVLFLMGLIGYWSFTTLESGTEHKKDQKIAQLEGENKGLKTELENLKEDLSILQSKIDEPIPEIPKEEPKKVAYKHQALIDKLDKLIVSNVVLKEKSKGANVGVVQNFLNIYNKTSNKIDNDYGPGTVEKVKAFQKDSGLSVDGEASKNTFSKMIEWLKKEG